MSAPDQPVRLKLEIRGSVQGVGFRPFVFRLAEELSLTGWVVNDSRGVSVEVEGTRGAVSEFLRRVREEKPAASEIREFERLWAEPAGYARFEIRASDRGGEKSVEILPDLATCPACLAEVLDPADRRHGYPFTNCTHCGPRFTIVRELPYDRSRTTMAGFTMCALCRSEYESPRDRRFHAQPNACPDCGPAITLGDAAGRAIATGGAALDGASEALARGRVVAVKGLGGFHLMVDARDSEAVARLRSRKARREKPLAVLVADRAAAERICEISEDEASALRSPEGPIVLVRRRAGALLAESVAPGNPYVGLMLPPTPLHHLLARAAGFPLVATSGNLSEEPICIDDDEALLRLGGIADLFLGHDRPIARHVDDSVASFVRGELRLLRRARGFAPRAVILPSDGPALLAVGAHLKNAVALGVGRRAFVSQHIGDMGTAESMAAFERVIADFLAMYDARPEAIVHDLHPDYASTHWARRAAAGGFTESPLDRLAGLPLIGVQHHHAHLASCMADAGATGRALGVTWDGTGAGTDGSVWGGEFLLGDASGFERVAHLLPFRLAGGEAAVREPRRAALGLLAETFGGEALDWDDLAPVRSFQGVERRILATLLERGAMSPRTTSAGRLFDGIAALAGLGNRSAFEGQAAMALEFAVDGSVREAYPLPVAPGGPPIVLDWRPLVAAVVDDVRSGVSPSVIAARFHNALVLGIAGITELVGERQVALSGGCFQNRRLTETTWNALTARGFRVVLQRQVPPGDGGIALGQLAIGAARVRSVDPPLQRVY